MLSRFPATSVWWHLSQSWFWHQHIPFHSLLKAVLLHPMMFMISLDLTKTYINILLHLLVLRSWMLLPGLTLINFHRPSLSTTFHIVGGGTAFLISEPASLFSAPTDSPTPSSHLKCLLPLKLFSSKLTVFNVYHNRLLANLFLYLFSFPTFSPI